MTDEKKSTKTTANFFFEQCKQEDSGWQLSSPDRKIYKSRILLARHWCES
jgi:hypothetical protein